MTNCINSKVADHVEKFIANKPEHTNGRFHVVSNTLIKKDENIIKVSINNKAIMQIDTQKPINSIEVKFISAVAQRRIEAIKEHFNWQFSSGFKEGKPFLVVDGDVKKIDRHISYTLLTN